MTGYPPNWDSIRNERARRDDYICGNCGGKLGDSEVNELHVHHIVPRSKGGSDQLDNLRTLCKKCHNSIHHKDKVAPTHVSERKQKPESPTKPEPTYPDGYGGEPILNSTQYAFWAIVSLGGWLMTYAIMSAIGNEALFYFVLLFSIPVWFILPVGMMIELGRGE